MTQEEVDLIYDYLHENYEYRDGELLHNHDLVNKTKKKGEFLGSFSHYTQADPYIMVKFYINKKCYRMKLVKLIFIYHHKYLPERIYHLDGNSMNTMIDNLQETDHSAIHHKLALKKGLSLPKVLNKDGTQGYSVRTRCNKKTLDLGTYRTEQTALSVYKTAKDMILEKKLDANEIKKIIALKYPESSLNIVSITGYKGVYPSGNRFISQVCLNGKKKYLGIFNTPEEAHQAYLKAKEEHPNNTRSQSAVDSVSK